MTTENLTPAAELAAMNKAHFPNESREYRKARNALLAGEIELRRHLWRVAEQRRALPAGGEVTRHYRFETDPIPPIQPTRRYGVLGSRIRPLQTSPRNSHPPSPSGSLTGKS